MKGVDRQVAPWRQRLRDSRWLIAVELALIAAAFVADEHHYIFFSKTPYLLALGWLSMMLRGEQWRDIGLSVPPEWRRLLLIGVVAGVAMELLELFATQPLLVALTGKFPDLSAFHDLIGNVPMLLLVIGASWIVAGLGEELVWRGYVLNRVADLLGGGRLGWAISIGIASVVFGLAHSYQDLTGIIENGVAGALLALLYIACGRNLIAPIVAHGVTDTIDSLTIFSGHYPGMH
jgi:membrane protease YdiL (CAAX protease family)